MLNGVHILKQFGPSREVKIVTQLIISLVVFASVFGLGTHSAGPMHVANKITALLSELL